MPQGERDLRTFHDLRHTFVTNARRAGIDYFRIMAITGHKTMVVFKRYNTVDEADLRQAMQQMDTSMDTCDERGRRRGRKSLKLQTWAASSTGRATDS